MSTINWRGNQGCDPGNSDGNGWTVEEWVDGSLRSRTFDTRKEAEDFQARALVENVWD